MNDIKPKNARAKFNTLDFSSTGNKILDFGKALENTYDKITFDLEDLSFISPSGLCYLVASIELIAHEKPEQTIEVKFPKNTNIHNYLERMNFYKNINVYSGNEINRNNCSDRLIEIQKIDITSGNKNKISEDLVKIFESKLKGYDKRILETIAYAIGEIIENTISHSESPIGGYVCAQTYSDRLEICIIDCGIGIPQSLRDENNKHKDKISYFERDEEFISFAIGKGVTSKTQEDSGEGLFFTTEFIKENEGRIKIISDKGLLYINKSNDINTSEIKGKWQGTIVMLELNLNKPINVKDIFDREFPEDSEEYNELDGLFL